MPTPGSVFPITALVIKIGFLLGQSGGDFYSSIGKIYVVVTVIAIIFLVLAFYLFRIDRKISRLENRENEH